MRISDWSSDVCSSDLFAGPSGGRDGRDHHHQAALRAGAHGRQIRAGHHVHRRRSGHRADRREAVMPIGRLNHVGVATPSIEKSVEMYVSLLGATKVHEPFDLPRSEEHTSELQSLMRISYAVFCLKKKKKKNKIQKIINIATKVSNKERVTDTRREPPEKLRIDAEDK